MELDKPNTSHQVTNEMDMLISFEMNLDASISRAKAAQRVLDKKEGWYWQTPGGEYLAWVASRRINGQRI